MKKKRKDEFSPMQEALMKVLSCMEMEMNDKVLICLYLQKDKQIYDFLMFLKESVPEEEVKDRVEEIKYRAKQIRDGIL